VPLSQSHRVRFRLDRGRFVAVTGRSERKAVPFAAASPFADLITPNYVALVHSYWIQYKTAEGDLDTCAVRKIRRRPAPRRGRRWGSRTRPDGGPILKGGCLTVLGLASHLGAHRLLLREFRSTREGNRNTLSVRYFPTNLWHGCDPSG
jgi:hypothetical protein